MSLADDTQYGKGDSEMSTRKLSPLLIHLPPLLHLCFSVGITAPEPYAGWFWMGLNLFDFPFSIIFSALLYHSVNPMITFGIFGTLWWYFLSYKAWVVLNRSRESRR